MAPTGITCEARIRTCDTRLSTRIEGSHALGTRPRASRNRRGQRGFAMSEIDRHEVDADELVELHERAIVWDAIRAAFAWRVRPLGRVSDVGSPIADDVADTLSGRDWWEVSARELQRIRIDINTLRPDAFWYYFRSFAYESLIVEGSSDDVGGWMVSALRPPEGYPYPRFVDKVAALSAEERRCVCRFVHWYA